MNPADDASARFDDRLAITVTLTIAGTDYEFKGAEVSLVELRLEGYGFAGTIELHVQDDEARGGGFTDALLEPFLGADLVEAAVEVKVVHHEAETSAELQPIRVEGLVTHKTMEEGLLRHSADQPILVRRYRMTLADPAQVLWTQHFPCQLYTSKTPQQVIEEHTGEYISFTYDWPVLTESKSQWFVHLPPEREASFYDFVVWLAVERDGVLSYDYNEQKYALTAFKSSEAQAQPLFGDDVRSAEIVVPPVPRHVVVVADSYGDGPRSEKVTQEQAVDGVRHDRPMRSIISQQVDDAVALQRTRLRVPKYEARLSFARVPTVDVVPGSLLSLAAANRWSADSMLVSPTWRVRDLWLRASFAGEPLARDHQMGSAAYVVTMNAHLEQSDDERVVLPAHRAPFYPAYLEGKVVSEKGDEDDKTYQTYRNETTSLDEYSVRVPLYEDQKVVAPFEPAQGSGNAYVPSYREERVLLSMELECSRIERLLDWREGAALSMDVQGEQVLFGVSGTSHTSINHVYDDANPVFNIERTHDNDGALMQMDEGQLRLEVAELEDGEAVSGTLTCKIVESKTDGITIEVVNGDDEITQTVTMDGTTLKLQVAGSSETSSITMVQDKITIDTKDLVVTTRDTISCTATGTATYESEDDTTIKSAANLIQQATSDMKASAANVKVTADSEVSISALNAKVAATTALDLSGSSEAKLTGATVKVAADATLNAESSGMATLGGSMTTIKGSLITAG